MNTLTDSSLFMTVSEVAEYLRVGKSTVWRWIDKGQLPAFRIGRSWRVRREDLERYVTPQPVTLHQNSSSQPPELT